MRSQRRNVVLQGIGAEYFAKVKDGKLVAKVTRQDSVLWIRQPTGPLRAHTLRRPQDHRRRPELRQVTVVRKPLPRENWWFLVLVDRLIVEGSDGVEVETVDLHPRLTVVAGMPPRARTAFFNLLAGALHGSVRGVHAEVTDDNGRRLVVLRPGVGQGRVVEVESSADISMHYRGYDGKIDLLAGQGGQTTLIRIGADDLIHSAGQNNAVRAMSEIDQDTLWTTADKALRDGHGSKAHGRWNNLTGEVNVQWAVEHRHEVEAAANLRQHIGALRSLSSSVPDVSDDDAIALAHGIVSRLGNAGQEAGIRPPLILDEPFVNLEPAVIPLLLELLPGLVGDLQVMLLTNDDAIASWARLEALAGELSLVEPALTGG